MISQRAKKAVIWFSHTKAIHKNLALEDWLFRNYDFSETDGLLMWSNKPAVVIGRHQNLFTETNLEYLDLHKAELARRQSGGGTVYHSDNCFQFSIFTSKERHNRLRNLELMCSTLKDKFNVNATINARHDILINNLKVSGTAAKISSNVAYHHFTMLCDMPIATMKSSLKSSFTKYEAAGDLSIESKATPSVRSNVGWLFKFCRPFIGNFLQVSYAEAFAAAHGVENVEQHQLKVEELNDALFPGLSEIERKLVSWDFVFGMNPPFTLIKKDPKNDAIILKAKVEKARWAEIDGQDEKLIKHYRLILGQKFDLEDWNRMYNGRQLFLQNLSQKTSI